MIADHDDYYDGPEPWDPDDDDRDYDDYNDDPCHRCGPFCEHWGGDNLCMLAIEQQVQEQEFYDQNHVIKDVHCPVCKKRLTLFEVPSSELWVWPGDYLNVFIPLGIYGAFACPKGELHREGRIVHVWTGSEKKHSKWHREKLIRLELPEEQEAAPQEPREATSEELQEIPF